jgi:hypothetical protein
MAHLKAFTCLACKRRRLRKSAFVHPLTRLCRHCAKPMQRKMGAEGRSLEGCVLEMVLLVEEETSWSSKL